MVALTHERIMGITPEYYAILLDEAHISSILELKLIYYLSLIKKKTCDRLVNK
jgi:hypothetical protein